MPYLVLAYPELAQTDFLLIQEYRKNCDRLYSAVDPHFTLVFPVNEVRKEDFISEIRKQSQDLHPFEFSVRKAIVHKDAFSNDHYVFLVPDAGYNDFIKIHDRLYSELFKDYLRHDIEFSPHITIGNSKNISECGRIADQWNSLGHSIGGSISGLTVIDYENDMVTPIEQIKLG